MKFDKIFAIFLLALLLVGVVSAALPFKIISQPVKYQTIEQIQPVADEEQQEQESATVDDKTVGDNAKSSTPKEDVLPSEDALPSFFLLRKADYIPQQDAQDSVAETQDDAEEQNDVETAVEDKVEKEVDGKESSDVFFLKKESAADRFYDVRRDALTMHDVWWWGLDEDSTELHIDSTEVSGDTTEGSTFTISVTATDSDDSVTRISLGNSPYGGSDYDIRDCPADVNSCTMDFEISEDSAGTYTYMIKAKNERDQIVTDAVTVTVTEYVRAWNFNFRTAAMDGNDHSLGIVDYVDSEIFVWSEGIPGVTLYGTPFTTFSVPSDHIVAARYDASGYIVDTDYFYFDSRLPTCSGATCYLDADVDGVSYTTTCGIVLSDYHYLCTLTNDEGYSISFDYRAEGDPLGPNTVRRYNLLYPQYSPVVDFGSVDVNFIEGGDFTLPLSDYVYDEDTSFSDIVWTARGNHNIDAVFDRVAGDVTFSQHDTAWIGNEIITLIAHDPEGNSGSDILTVRVINEDNNAPVIISKNPEGVSANVGMGSSRLFSIDAIDPDYDYLSVTWRKGGSVVLSDSFSYLYSDDDGLPHPLTVTVSDGVADAAAAWDIDIVEPIGDISGTVTDSDTGEVLSDVNVYLRDGASIVESEVTDLSGYYAMNDVLEGTYSMTFAKDNYYDYTVDPVVLFAGDNIVQDVQMDIIPPPIGTLQGIVRNSATALPIGGVLVQAVVVSGDIINTTTTDPSGNYEMDLEEGSYTVRFSKLGYEPVDFSSVDILTGVVTVQDADLTESPDLTATISGTITDEAGLPLDAVLVEAKSGSLVINSTTTDAFGHYSMTIISDIYDISATLSGYRNEMDVGVSVPAGSTTTEDFTMITWWDNDWEVKYEVVLGPSAYGWGADAVKLDLRDGVGGFVRSDFQADCGDLRVVNSAEDATLPYNILDMGLCSPTRIELYANQSIDDTADTVLYIYGRATTPKLPDESLIDGSSQDAGMWGAWEFDETSSLSDADAVYGIALPRIGPNEIISSAGRGESGSRYTNRTDYFAADAGMIGSWTDSTSHTYSCWVKFEEDWSPDTNWGVFSIYHSPWTAGGYFSSDVYFLDATTLRMDMQSQGVFGSDSSLVVSPVLGSWAMITGVWNTATNVHNVYFNAVKGSDGAFSFSVNPANKITIGRSDFDGDGILEADTGLLHDQCILWQRALSDDDVEWLYNGGKGRPWPMYYYEPTLTLTRV